MVSFPFCDVLLRGQIPPSAAYPSELVTLGDHIRARRLDRGLGQRDVARLIGVSTSTISGWETVGREPEVRYLPAIIEFLGYNPEPEPSSFGERVAWHRQRHGLARKRLAPILGVDPASVNKVEVDRPIGRTLTKIFEAFLAHCDAGKDLATLSLPHRPRPGERPTSLETIGDHIRARRLDLGLDFEEAADQIGCSTSSLTNWEVRGCGVSIRKMPAVLAFLGYDPHPPPSTLSELLRAFRRQRGITAMELAQVIGVNETTITGWETGATQPTGRGAPKLWHFLERECPAELRALRLP